MPVVTDICPGNFKVNLGKSNYSVSHEGNNYMCTCQFYSQNKLPCRHIIPTVRYQEKDLPILAYNSGWLKKNTAWIFFRFIAAETMKPKYTFLI